MKRHVQEPGIRRWFGQDLLDLQSEPLRALERFFSDYSSCVLSGCVVSGASSKSVSAGLVHFRWNDGSNPRYCVVEFHGSGGLPSVFTRYLVLDEVVDTRQYEDGGVKAVSRHLRAVLSSSVPPTGPHLEITQSGPSLLFHDAIQRSSHRFVSDAEKSQWNNKVDMSETSNSPQALKFPRLDGAGRYPATIITQDDSHRFVTINEKTFWNNKASTDLVSNSTPGLMRASDYIKLLGIATGANLYVHPASHSASMITTDTARRFVTDAEKDSWDSRFPGVAESPNRDFNNNTESGMYIGKQAAPPAMYSNLPGEINVFDEHTERIFFLFVQGLPDQGVLQTLVARTIRRINPGYVPEQYSDVVQKFERTYWSPVPMNVSNWTPWVKIY